MTVLRSREIVPTIRTKSPPKTLKNRGVIIEPPTPAKALEPLKKTSYSTTASLTHLAQNSDHVRLGLDSDPGLVSRRRSHRLSCKSSSIEMVENVVSSRKRKSASAENATTRYCNDFALENVEDRVFDLRGKERSVSERIRSKTRLSRDFDIAIAGEKNGGVDEIGLDSSVSDIGTLGQRREKIVSAKKVNGKNSFDVEFLGLESVGDGDREKGCLNLRSGKKILKGRVQGNDSDVVGIGFLGLERGDDGKPAYENGKGGKERERETLWSSGSEEGVVINESERGPRSNGNGSHKSRRRFSGEDKKKGKSVDDDLIINGVDLGRKIETSFGDGVSDSDLSGCLDPKEVEIPPRDEENGTGRGARTRLSREEKGKGKVVEVDMPSNHSDMVESDLEPKVDKSLEDTVAAATGQVDSVRGLDRGQVMETNVRADATRRSKYKKIFRDLARKNASRFAHFPSQEEEENHVVDEAERELPQPEAKKDLEDWPGPFSVAMKIIKDRELNMNPHQPISYSDKSNPARLKWIPKKDQQRDRPMLVVPSLQELCMGILVKHADAITSLDSVPDVFRHKLSQLLCDCRRMNGHFLDLLVSLSESPTEVRVRDCSWLTEEQFTRTFARGDLKKLKVLQLDQCGRCLPDYILFATLARSSNILPALTTISLKGACRLSDVGLSALVSSAPVLRSINLSQCPLLTSDGINTLADTLGSVLKELYIDDCETVDAMLILPSMLKLEHLEVLSISGIETVCDDFINQFVAVRGQNMKELALAHCMRLTDSSLKAIAESCSGLRAIDLTNLCKLTDSALGFLANGCQTIQTLKLCRNAFSDKAVAAYLETCGESLKELSLNNVNKVAHNTAISLARRSRNLLSLDLSWCRNLTDEALGLIVDSCLSLKVLKLFGCTQITNVFMDGHSNTQVQVIGLKMSPILEHLELSDLLGPVHCSSV